MNAAYRRSSSGSLAKFTASRRAREEKCSVTLRWPNLYVRLFYNVKLAFQFVRDRNLAVEKPFGHWII